MECEGRRVRERGIGVREKEERGVRGVRGVCGVWVILLLLVGLDFHTHAIVP